MILVCVVGAANGANGANNNGKAAALPPASPAVTPNNSSASSVKTVPLPATPVVKVIFHVAFWERLEFLSCPILILCPILGQYNTGQSLIFCVSQYVSSGITTWMQIKVTQVTCCLTSLVRISKMWVKFRTLCFSTNSCPALLQKYMLKWNSHSCCCLRLLWLVWWTTLTMKMKRKMMRKKTSLQGSGLVWAPKANCPLWSWWTDIESLWNPLLWLSHWLPACATCLTEEMDKDELPPLSVPSDCCSSFSLGKRRWRVAFVLFCFCFFKERRINLCLSLFTSSFSTTSSGRFPNLFSSTWEPHWPFENSSLPSFTPSCSPFLLSLIPPHPQP